MSNVLKRIKEVQRAKESKVPSQVTQDITDLYISDLKDKAYKKAHSEIQSELIESANQAELDGANTKIEAMRIETETVKNLLIQARSEATQANDLSKSLKAEVKLNSIALDELKEIHAKLMEEQKVIIRSLELAVIKAESRPAPVTTQVYQPAPLPSFEFHPVRGQNGMIESVTATPI